MDIIFLIGGFLAFCFSTWKACNGLAAQNYKAKIEAFKREIEAFKTEVEILRGAIAAKDEDRDFLDQQVNALIEELEARRDDLHLYRQEHKAAIKEGLNNSEILATVKGIKNDMATLRTIPFNSRLNEIKKSVQQTQEAVEFAFASFNEKIVASNQQINNKLVHEINEATTSQSKKIQDIKDMIRLAGEHNHTAIADSILEQKCMLESIVRFLQEAGDSLDKIKEAGSCGRKAIREKLDHQRDELSSQATEIAKIQDAIERNHDNARSARGCAIAKIETGLKILDSLKVNLCDMLERGSDTTGEITALIHKQSSFMLGMEDRYIKAVEQAVKGIVEGERLGAHHPKIEVVHNDPTDAALEAIGEGRPPRIMAGTTTKIGVGEPTSKESQNPVLGLPLDLFRQTVSPKAFEMIEAVLNTGTHDLYTIFDSGNKYNLVLGYRPNGSRCIKSCEVVKGTDEL